MFSIYYFYIFVIFKIDGKNFKLNQINILKNK